MGINKIATLWGFAEATLFFIVPDVWLTIIARHNIKKGIIACFYSLAGALLGGTLLFWWGATHFDYASKTIEAIPAINPAMLIHVQQTLSEQGLLAMLLGPLNGIPYKTYAIQAAQTGIDISSFLLVSIPARLVRFLLVTLFSYYLSRFISQKINIDPLVIILSVWLLFYCGYFYTMGI